MTVTKPPRPLEDQCEDTIIKAAKLLGWKVHAERKARSSKGWRTPIKGDPGWPDLVLVRGTSLWFVELKRKPNKLSADQKAWLDALSVDGAVTHVIWVPEGMDSFLSLLARPETVPT